MRRPPPQHRPLLPFPFPPVAADPPLRSPPSLLVRGRRGGAPEKRVRREGAPRPPGQARPPAAPASPPAPELRGASGRAGHGPRPRRNGALPPWKGGFGLQTPLRGPWPGSGGRGEGPRRAKAPEGSPERARAENRMGSSGAQPGLGSEHAPLPLQGPAPEAAGISARAHTSLNPKLPSRARRSIRASARAAERSTRLRSGCRSKPIQSPSSFLFALHVFLLTLLHLVSRAPGQRTAPACEELKTT